MRCNLHIVCDRCRMVVKHAFKDCDGTTGGYYEVKGQRAMEEVWESWRTIPL